ncbi:unnamed protein product [Hymenolepis diminuta]|uniref:F-box domain-containing protein n=1 Tax=Hymenolepis diminuta TaxID=6216 RepID=A0A0R3SWZ7_HYMDI|nr:unnamed protein product [Hymenolepis diminuta]
MAQPTEGSTKSIDCLNIAEISRICDFLEAPDLVRACLTIRHWDAILKYPSKKQLLQNYVEKIKWLDRKLIRLFRPLNELDLCIDDRQAILHHDAEEKVMQARLQAHGLPLNHCPIELIISYCNDADRDHYEQRVQISDSFRLNGFISDDSNKADVVVIVVFGRFADKGDMEFISRVLKPLKTLLILHVTEGCSNIQWLRECTGQYYTYLSRLPSKYWRVWHIEKTGNELLNLTDAVKWASCTFLPPSDEL